MKHQHRCAQTGMTEPIGAPWHFESESSGIFPGHHMAESSEQALMIKNKFLLSIFILLIANPSFASFISIQTTIRSLVEENRIDLEISTANKGDEAAHNVQVEIVFEGETYFTSKKPKLGSNQTISFNKSIEISPSKQGCYPLIIVTHYTDAHQYPFSALSCIIVSNKRDAPPSVIFGNMADESFSTKGRVVLTVKNRGENDISTSVRLFAPRELKIINSRQQVSMPARSQKEIYFDMENFSALGGSTYQIYATAEYEIKGIHQTGIIPGTLTITKSRQIVGISHTVVLVILIVCTLIFIAAQYIKKK